MQTVVNMFMTGEFLCIGKNSPLIIHACHNHVDSIYRYLLVEAFFVAANLILCSRKHKIKPDLILGCMLVRPEVQVSVSVCFLSENRSRQIVA